jgi:hypothetical protein
LLCDLSRRLSIPATSGGPISAIITYFNYLSLLETDDDSSASDDANDINVENVNETEDDSDHEMYGPESGVFGRSSSVGTNHPSIVAHNTTTNSICLCNACLTSGQRRSKITTRLKLKLEQRKTHSQQQNPSQQKTEPIQTVQSRSSKTSSLTVPKNEPNWYENPAHQPNDSLVSLPMTKSQRRKNKPKEKQKRQKIRKEAEDFGADSSSTTLQSSLNIIDPISSKEQYGTSDLIMSDYDRLEMQNEIDQFAKDLQHNISFWSKYKQSASLIEYS